MIYCKDTLLSKRFKYTPNVHHHHKLSKATIEAKSHVEQKIESNIYRFEDKPCFCGSDDFLLLAERDYYGLYHPFGICKHCGLMRANPRMNLDSYIQFYDKEYRTLYSDNDWDKEELYALRTKQGRDGYNFISKHLTNITGPVFDIGCNMGMMLFPFHQAGCEVMGVDYGSEYIEYGRKKTSLNLVVGGVNQLKKFGKKAELVIINDVFEHFLDLEAELQAIREVMEDGSYVFISVPGTFWWLKYRCRYDIMGMIQNAHTYQFTPAILNYVMECNGFELMYGNEKIKAIFKKVSTFRDKKDVPTGEYKKALTYFRRVERFYPLRKCIVKTSELLHVKKLIERFVLQPGHDDAKSSTPASIK